ncbi:MAG: hypothetical protein ACK5MJ_04435 [Alphaproteobacteria bacterium]
MKKLLIILGLTGFALSAVSHASPNEGRPSGRQHKVEQGMNHQPNHNQKRYDEQKRDNHQPIHRNKAPQKRSAKPHRQSLLSELIIDLLR